jgi:hypothetical protein
MRIKLDNEARRFVETATTCCVIDIHGWRDMLDPPGDTLFINLLSTHVSRWPASWRARLAQAWKALQGKPYPFIEFYSREQAAEFIGAVNEVADTVWPEASP